jgi:PKD repeat protein
MLGGLLLLAPLLVVVVDAGPPGRSQADTSLLAALPAMPTEGGGDNGSDAEDELTLSWGDPEAPAPIPVLTLLDSEGMAPFTVHVHALDSDLGAGDPLTARYEWNFGDEAGSYNELVGFNAAHVYDEPGQYTITLRITNECGRQAELTAPITVFSDGRARVYVAADGNDTNDGRTPGTPIRTFARAMQLLDNDMVVLLRRGDRFDVAAPPSPIARHNWALGAWGEGDRPELCWVGGLGGGAILPLSADQCAAALIEDVHFTSKYVNCPDRDICTAIFVGGENITVRRCTFGHVTDALNCNRQPRGVLSCDNVATNLHAYYLWGEGWDHTHVGNVVTGSTHEHNIRFGGIHRVLIADNELTNSPKRCLWAMLGEYAWIAGNTLREGRLTIGPDHTDGGGSPADRFRLCVAERNVIDKIGFPETAAVEVEHGAEHVILRNNVISIAGNSTIDVRGYSETKQRTTVDLRIFNNTGICPGTCGRFVRCGTDTESLHIANNLFVAPHLITGDYQKAILFILDEDLSSFVQIGHNLWPIPAGCDWGEDVYHYLWPYWANLEGCKDIAEWAAYEATRAEAYENVTLDEDYRPAVGSGAAEHAARVPGVFTDLTGAPRPGDGAWTAGAVEVPQ